MKLTIGTRNSRLARIQTDLAAAAIRAHWPEAQITILPIITRGDRIADRPLTQIGGRGVFIEEIEQALLSGKIDLAVHSAKDLPVKLAEGTCVPAVLPRAQAGDMLVTRMGTVLRETCRIGTSSLRRAQAVRNKYPNAEIADLRGNVETRLKKLADGQYDAIILAEAGLSRLGLLEDPRFDFRAFTLDEIVPAPCQGIIALQTRTEDAAWYRMVNDTDTYYCFETERFLLERLDAGCSSPTGALAQIRKERIVLTATRDQKRILREEAPVSERFALAERMVNAL